MLVVHDAGQPWLLNPTRRPRRSLSAITARRLSASAASRSRSPRHCWPARGSARPSRVAPNWPCSIPAAPPACTSWQAMRWVRCADRVCTTQGLTRKSRPCRTSRRHPCGVRHARLPRAAWRGGRPWRQHLPSPRRTERDRQQIETAMLAALARQLGAQISGPLNVGQMAVQLASRLGIQPRSVAAALSALAEGLLSVGLPGQPSPGRAARMMERLASLSLDLNLWLCDMVADTNSDLADLILAAAEQANRLRVRHWRRHVAWSGIRWACCTPSPERQNRSGSA